MPPPAGATLEFSLQAAQLDREAADSPVIPPRNTT